MQNHQSYNLLELHSEMLRRNIISETINHNSTLNSIKQVRQKLSLNQFEQRRNIEGFHQKERVYLNRTVQQNKTLNKAITINPTYSRLNNDKIQIQPKFRSSTPNDVYKHQNRVTSDYQSKVKLAKKHRYQKIYLKSFLFPQKNKNKFNESDDIQGQNYNRMKIQKRKDSKNTILEQDPRIKISQKKKIFSFNSQDDYVKRLLLKNGWKECGPRSKIYTLKWSYKDSIEDYQLLRNSNYILTSKNKEGNKKQIDTNKYYNHIKNNIMVTKDGFYNIYCRMMEANKHPQRFIPCTYDLGKQFSLFQQDYTQTSFIIIIRKHYQYFTSQLSQEWLNNIYKKIGQIKIDDLFFYLQNAQQNRIISEQYFSIPVNIPLLLYTLVYAQNNINNKYLCEETHNFSIKYENILKDDKILKSLIKFSKVQLPYSQYSFMRQSQILNLNSDKNEQIQINLNDNYIKIKGSPNFLPPSLDLILTVVRFHHFYKNNMPEKYINIGQQNLWIIKPNEGSKGIGIDISSSVQQIKLIKQSSVMSNIIQRYIQKIWILDQNIISNVKSDVDRNFLRKSKIYLKKFDIRQWVFINLPNSYIFSHYYLKICPSNYNIKVPKDHHSHLSNYSINSDLFKNMDEKSVMSQTQFQEIMKMLNLHQQFLNLKIKINNCIKRIVKQGMNNMAHVEGCFDILGVDIILDKNLNPWVLEVNMSPACSERTQWLIQMCQNMADGVFRKVMPAQLFDYTLPKSIYKWNNLYDDYIQKQIITPQLLIQGTSCKLSKASITQNNLIFQNQQYEKYDMKIRNLQKQIRRFLSKIN